MANTEDTKALTDQQLNDKIKEALKQILENLNNSKKKDK